MKALQYREIGARPELVDVDRPTPGPSRPSTISTTAAAWSARVIVATCSAAPPAPRGVTGCGVCPAAERAAETGAHEEASSQKPGMRTTFIPRR